ncbi:ATP-grasp domain-containing protein [Halorussus lipolyticus]|uniref:ATP-grasp domain-containing protein n=1 Tax=Halorussus lipolyticus TaxID=3034024 RepID=UPI0023E7B9D4|nr:ATP-grasp domain-containing protein [Halorussus sp. DT80]
MTVVLIGIRDLPELKTLAEALRGRGEEVVVCDVMDWPGETPLTYAPGDDDFVADSSFEFSEVTGAYVHVHAVFRTTDMAFREEFKAAHELRPVFNQWREHRSVFESLSRMFESRGIDVLPRPHNQYLQEHKPWQLDRYESADLPIPDTLISNDASEVEAFYERHDRVIYKPVAKGAGPSELTADDLTEERLKRLATAPVQFQEMVPGDDLRLYVLDGEVVGAMRYDSENFSFKLDQNEGKEVAVGPADVSDEIESTAVRAAGAINLQFGAADIIRRPDGGHVLLELNEAPAFAAADVRADQNVAQALADHLAEE